jgi:hypothetical protein
MGRCSPHPPPPRTPPCDRRDGQGSSGPAIPRRWWRLTTARARPSRRQGEAAEPSSPRLLPPPSSAAAGGMATQESEAERTQRVMGRALREKESQLRLGCVRASGRESQPASPPGGVCRLDPAAAPAHGLISPRFRSAARGLAPPLMCLGRRAGDVTGARGVCVCAVPAQGCAGAGGQGGAAEAALRGSAVRKKRR